MHIALAVKRENQGFVLLYVCLDVRCGTVCREERIKQPIRPIVVSLTIKNPHNAGLRVSRTVSTGM